MGKILIGKIKNICKTYALVETNLGVGICHISNFSDYKINDLRRFIEIYNPNKFMVLDMNKDTNTINLSYKLVNQVFCFPNSKLCHYSSGFVKLKQYVSHLAYLEMKKKGE